MYIGRQAEKKKSNLTKINARLLVKYTSLHEQMLLWEKKKSLTTTKAIVEKEIKVEEIKKEE